jgi:DNA-binding response OmpR family regulator
MSAAILLVEDDHDMREVIARVLERTGYDVTQAANGEQAIGLLTRTDPERPIYDVVLTDIVMGNIDGVEVANVARTLPEPPEVILLTGYATLDTAIAAVRAGVFDYLQKPCQMNLLRERLDAAITRRETRLQQARASDALQRVAETINQVRQTGMPTPSGTDQTGMRYLTVGALRIDTYRHEVWLNNEPLHITPTEYMILSNLAASPGQVLSFLDLARPIYGDGTDQTSARDLIRWHMRNLRHKFHTSYIISVRGVGYMLANPDEPGGPAA